MKTSVNIFNNLNESFNEEFKKLQKNKLKESVTIEEVTRIHNRIEEASDTDEIQEIIYDISDGVLEDEVQRAYDQSLVDGDSLEDMKGFIISTLEDNAEYLDEGCNKKLNETGEWDDNDEEMAAWKEDLRGKAEYIAEQTHGSVASVSGFDKYQGPYAIISTPIHGDVELWYDQEDDTGLSLNCKIAHVGWIQGGADRIADLLDRDQIPEDEIINESEKAKIKGEIKDLEDKIKDTPIEDLKAEDAKKLEKLEDKLEDDTLTEEDTKFYDYVKGLLDAGAIDDPKHYNSLSDKEKDDLIKNTWMKDPEIKKDYEKLNEEQVIQVNGTNEDKELDYIINDVTVLEPVSDGDVQAPDIDALLTLVDESLKADYGDNWGHINILSSRIDESSSYALVDISTPEIIKEFEERGIEDAAIGKNLILENADKLIEFKVNSLNGITRFSKKTNNAQATIKEWIETEFLHEAMKAKVEMEELEKAKNEKETVENYIACKPELRMEKSNIDMFIEMSKQIKDEGFTRMVQDKIYGFAAEFPANIEVTNKEDKYELKFTSRDEIVEYIFGKEWAKDPTEEVPGNEVVGVIKESEELNESYSQFNIGDIEVVFNPETYECLYSIPSANVKDKKINLTKIPTVATPYDTNTIIKDYVETKFGQIPTEAEKEMIDDKEIPAPEMEPEVEVQDTETIIDEPVEEAELPEEPTEVEGEPTPQEREEIQAETGDAVFVKIRPKQDSNIEDIRTKMLDGDTPTSSYIVVGEEVLSDEQWNNLTENLTNPQSWLEGVKALDRKNYSFNVIKVTNSNASYTLLIDPLGYNYPRYVAVVE